MRHRAKGGIIKEGRRPSVLPHIQSLRHAVKTWRQQGYPDTTATTRALLRHWFEAAPHRLEKKGEITYFYYNWAQREAIETIIYLYEVFPKQQGLAHPAGLPELIRYFYPQNAADKDALILGLPPEEKLYPRYCTKIATGAGKTKIMSLVIAWSYFNAIRENHPLFTTYFLIIAPNLIVYERLKEDFEGGKIFHEDPVIPPGWRSLFQLDVVLQDEPHIPTGRGLLYLTNIHRLYPREKAKKAKEPSRVELLSVEELILGPKPLDPTESKARAETLRERIARHGKLFVLNDEAHHLHDTDLAWSQALFTLHEQMQKVRPAGGGPAGILLQVDLTATPRHTNGDYFRHIIVDFPLGEAVDLGIVKVPLLGESSALEPPSRKDRDLRAVHRYHRHLKLGYEVYVRFWEELNRVRKPILFIMTEDAKSADEIAEYLNKDKTFPLLNGRVLNLHTRLKGKIVSVQREGRIVQEFVETEEDIRPEDLEELRRWSRALDLADSPYRCIVSVLMLREGWDVRNVTVIVPLRAYSAKAQILPEQTLGRGLRRMFSVQSTGERCAVVPETVVVIEHPAFSKLYEEELEREGVSLATIRAEDVYPEHVTIYPDLGNKPNELDIQIPHVQEEVEKQALAAISPEEVEQAFKKLGKTPLPLASGPTYQERHIISSEILRREKLSVIDHPVLIIQHYAKVLGHKWNIPMSNSLLSHAISYLLEELAFGKRVDIYNPQFAQRLFAPDVEALVLEVMDEILRAKIQPKVTHKWQATFTEVSKWRPYQVSRQDPRPFPASRTLFNLVPVDSGLEEEFVKEVLEKVPEVEAFARNAGPDALSLEYLDKEGIRRYYVPDFIVRTRENGQTLHYLVELKGRLDIDALFKARAALAWCDTATRALRPTTEWRYLFIAQERLKNGFYPFSSFSQLVRTCEGHLRELKLIKESPSRPSQENSSPSGASAGASAAEKSRTSKRRAAKPSRRKTRRKKKA
ncbi:MAG: DEAD/DEAH box helicase family protein [Bacteroidia bacterium]